MKTKVNKVPLVGPRGRKELLYRINELEAQVTQQDYLHVEMDDVTTPQVSEKRRLRELVQQGVIFNAIIVTEVEDGETGERGFQELRVIAHDALSKTLTVYFPSEESNWTISYAE